MKRIWMMAVVICLNILSAHALVVTVEGFGEITPVGMEITVNEAETDIMTGKQQMGLKGSIISEVPVSVTILRSATGLEDEFCCANQCTSGNGQKEEMLNFAPSGLTHWYCHYTPAPGSEEQISYIFSDGFDILTLVVRYNYTTQDLEEVKDNSQCTKVLKDGILYIIKDNKTYTIL